MVSTVALVIGLVVINVVRPGAGFNVDPATLDAKAVADYAKRAEAQSTVDFILNIIPTTFTDAFTGSGDLLQVLFVAVLFGYAMTHMGAKGDTVHQFIEACSHIFFAMMNALMKLAPIGAGGAMAFTIGRYGIDALRPLAALMGSFYLTCLLFVLVVLGTIAAFTGFSILRFIAYIKDELLTVLGTSSSESALVPLMQKLERLGCSQVGGGPGRAGGLLLQPGRDQHLPDHGRVVRRPGAEHRADAAAAADGAGRGDADVEGRVGRHRRRVHHAGGHAGGGPVDSGRGPGADPRHRPLHVRSAIDHQLHRQRRRRRGGGAVGRRAGYGTADRRAVGSDHDAAADQPAPGGLMHWIDWGILASFMAWIVYDGLKRTKDSQELDGYFLAKRSIPWWAAGISVMATQLSAITMIGTTGQGYNDGLRFIQFYFGLPLAMVVLSITLVPFFYNSGVYTAYEYLERRFDAKTRAFTSLLFLLSRGMSVRRGGGGAGGGAVAGARARCHLHVAADRGAGRRSTRCSAACRR